MTWHSWLKKTSISTGWGPRSIAFSWFIFVAEKTMVYGRYNITIVSINELVFMGIMSWFINQHSHHWGTPILFSIVGLDLQGKLVVPSFRWREQWAKPFHKWEQTHIDRPIINWLNQYITNIAPTYHRLDGWYGLYPFFHHQIPGKPPQLLRMRLPHGRRRVGSGYLGDGLWHCVHQSKH